MGGLALFGLAKALKIWAISSLGSRWSYRVLVLPGAPLVHAGPYRFISHPNYLAVVGEIASVAAIVWAPITGVLATIGFGWLMIARIRVEDRALGGAMAVTSSASAMKLPRWATALDVVAVLMALVAISVAIGGGFRIWIFDSRLSVTDPGGGRRSWSVVAIAIRHALVRQQPLPQRVVRRRRRLVARARHARWCCRSTWRRASACCSSAFSPSS